MLEAALHGSHYLEAEFGLLCEATASDDEDFGNIPSGIHARMEVLETYCHLAAGCKWDSGTFERYLRHPMISQEERRLINEGMGHLEREVNPDY